MDVGHCADSGDTPKRNCWIKLVLVDFLVICNASPIQRCSFCGCSSIDFFPISKRHPVHFSRQFSSDDYFPVRCRISRAEGRKVFSIHQFLCVRFLSKGVDYKVVTSLVPSDFFRWICSFSAAPHNITAVFLRFTSFDSFQYKVLNYRLI